MENFKCVLSWENRCLQEIEWISPTSYFFITFIFRYCNSNDPDNTMLFSDDEHEGGALENQFGGILTWHCQTCPLILTDSSEIRIMIPCGHVLCDECSLNKAKCPVASCKRKVQRISKPCIQEGDPVDEKAEVSEFSNF